MDVKDREARAALVARVAQVATAALEARKYVSAIDVLIGLGWLAQARVDEWRARKIPYLEAGIPTNPKRVAEAMAVFHAWAKDAGLKASETGYVGKTGGREPLRFSLRGDAEIEKAYRTHWVSPELVQKKPAGTADGQ